MPGNERGSKKSPLKIKAMGYKIIIQTGRVSAEREVTLKWLSDNNIYFDDTDNG